jgi:glycosyltransferase involved in cell wall biosynthesis
MVIPKYPPPVIGGMERQAHELSKTLQALGVTVVVVSGLTGSGRPGLEIVEGIPVQRIALLPQKWLRFPVTGWALFRAMLRERERIDVVHVHNMSWFGALAVLVAKGLRKPILAKLPTATEQAFGGKPLHLSLFTQCDAIAVMAQDSIEDMQRYGFPEQRIFKITNGVSMRNFAPPPPGERRTERLLNVLFVGRLEPAKGVLDLLAVWPHVLAGVGRPMRLTVCGDGPQEAELRAFIREHRLEGSVILKGHVSDVAAELGAADIFVLPSYVEGNSNAVLEAMASGLPVLSTRAGGTPLLVGPDGAEWLFEPRDRAGLQERLLRLANDASLRERVGQAMLARIHAHLTIEAVAERYRSVYEALAQGRRDEVGAASSPVFS